MVFEANTDQRGVFDVLGKLGTLRTIEVYLLASILQAKRGALLQKYTDCHANMYAARKLPCFHCKSIRKVARARIYINLAGEKGGDTTRSMPRAIETS